MEDEGSALVQLYVYDLSGGMARTLSPALLGQQIDGVWHTSIVLRGQEYFFGGGINVASAGATPFGRPLEVVDLGRTQLPGDVVEALLIDLSERYTPESYSLLDNNCNNFSDELAQLLTGARVPPHITGLPAAVLATPFGMMLRPLLSGLETQMRGMRQNAVAPQPAAVPPAPPAAGPATAGPSQQPEPSMAPAAPPARGGAAAEVEVGVSNGTATGLPSSAPGAKERIERELEAAVAEGAMAELQLREAHQRCEALRA